MGNKVLATAKLLFVIGGILIFGSVDADGFHASDKWTHLSEPSQKAVVTWDGQTETMVLSAAVQSDDIANFAWIVPIRSKSKPTVTAGDIQLFEDLADYFAVGKDERQQPGDLSLERGVAVIETKEVDVYDVTVLKADHPGDLIDWLSRNNYRVPEGAEPILAKYIEGGDTYFIANRIDLKNQYKDGLDLARRIYRDGEQRHSELCVEINAGLEKLGVRDRVCSDTRTTTNVSEAAGIINDAFNDPRNPFGLPRKWSTGLGNGVRVEEFCAGLARLEWDRATGRALRITRPPVAQWATAVFDDDRFVGAVNYHSYREDPKNYPRYLADSYVRENIGKLAKLGSSKNALLQRYFDSRASYHAATVDDGSCAKRLDEVAVTLDRELEGRMWEHFELDKILYVQPRAESHGSVSDASVASAAYSLIGDSHVVATANDQVTLAEVVGAIDGLQHGLGTPLKFVFEVEEPNYPLLISSLGRGDTVIEVYFVGPSAVEDASRLLGDEVVREITPTLRRQLNQHIPMSNAGYVTRLSYRGPLAGLNADAVFVEASAGGQTARTELKQHRDAPAPKSGLDDETAQRHHKLKVATDPHTPPGVLAAMAADEDDSIRLKVAEHPNTPVEALERLGADADWFVRAAVAKHGRTPSATLIQLADDESEETRFKVAMNPASPPEALQKLARSDSAKMRVSVAGNPGAPESLLQELASDPDESVAKQARAALEARGSQPGGSASELASPPNAASVIDTCPDAAEIKTISRDLNLVFDGLDTSYQCSETDKHDATLAAYNILRLLRAVRFPDKLPWTAHTSGYDWLKSLDLEQVVFFSCEASGRDSCQSGASDKAIYVSGALFDEDGKQYRNDPYYLLLTAGVVLHEARHTQPGGGKGHTGTCKSGTDQTLAEMGAWAVQYHYFRMLHGETGSFLSATTKERLKDSINSILSGSICETYVTRVTDKPHCFSYRIAEHGPEKRECYDKRADCLRFQDARQTMAGGIRITKPCH